MCLQNEDRDYELVEWLAFNKVDKFELLRANTQLEMELGKLNDIQIANLKDNLIEGFNEGQSIKKIAKNIEESGLPSLKRLSEDKIITFIPANIRSLIIAQTETVRVASECSKSYYKNSGVQEFIWMTNMDDLACPICAGLNGKIFKINSKIVPPAHVRCRCGISPNVELGE